MDLKTELFFYLATNGVRDLGREGLIDLFLVVVDGHMRRLVVLNIDKHLNRVIECKEEIVQLIEPLFVSNYALKDGRYKGATPVEESAACGLAHVPLPVGDHVNLPGKEVKLAYITLS